MGLCSKMWASVVVFLFCFGHSFGQISEDCDLFQINKLCALDGGNFLAEFDNLDEVSCQEACHFNTDCTHFTWNTFSNNLGPKCFLLTSCASTSECDGECSSSLAGPATPSYKEACCGDFYGSACVQDGSNMIHVEFNVPDEYQCQKMCQDPVMECQFFTFDSDVCILFSSCSEVEPCQSCVTGAVYPDLDVCEDPSIGVIIGGYGWSTVEIADSGSICGNVIADLPVAPRKG